MSDVDPDALADQVADLYPDGDIDPVNQAMAVINRPNDRGMYSQAAQAALALAQERGTPQQMIASLKGVKPEELKHSRAHDAFEGRKTITKHDLARHFHERMPEIKETVKSGDDTKYSGYSTPGGKDYREVLIHLPKQSKTADEISNEKGFGGWHTNLTPDQEAEIMADPRLHAKDHKSGHWDVPNVLAHLRLKDRDVIDDGSWKKALHLEELQSDWAQAHRAGAAVPEGPFIGNTNHWTDLGLKRALTEAAHGGHDHLVWTPGDEQADRYDLSKHVSSVHYHPESNNLMALDKSGHSVIDETVPQEKLADHVGKDIAKKLLESPKIQRAFDVEKRDYHSLEGDDLRVGGEGMKGYYDNILPKRLLALAREHDPEAGLSTVGVRWSKPVEHEDEELSPGAMLDHDQNGDPIHNIQRNYPSLKITPKMRASIKRRGFKAYSAGGSTTRIDHDAMADQVAALHRTPRKSGGSVNLQPTDAQKEAGNYSKEHIRFQGLDIALENKKGSTRSGTNANGRKWECTLPADYGYIKRTEGADGDHVDVYVGPNHDSRTVFIINQKHLHSGRFDEHKVMLGFNSEREAVEIYCKAFSDGRGRARIGGIETISMDAFRNWLKGDTTKPASAPSIIDKALHLVKRG